MAVNLEFREGIAIVELDRQEAMNALNDETVSSLAVTVQRIQDEECAGVVFLGAGDRAFCAGADIAELNGRTSEEHLRSVQRAQSLFHRIYQLRVPSVAVIHGFAFGGGLELALACTFRIATAKARMGLPEVKLGLIPAYGGTQRLSRLIGESRALELILSGRTVGAEEAHAIGLINQIFNGDFPLDAGLAVIRALTSHSRTASAHAIAAVKRGLDTGLLQGLSIEADQFMLCAQSTDAREGLAAFLEKRTPAFQRH